MANAATAPARIGRKPSGKGFQNLRTSGGARFYARFGSVEQRNGTIVFFRKAILRRFALWMGPRHLAQHTTETRAITYATAGVDIERANRTKQRIKYLAHKTFNRGVLSEIGGFGGLFSDRQAQVPGSGAGF